MPKIKESVLIQMDRLDAMFPGRETISLPEACEVTGFCRETLLADKSFPIMRRGRVSNAKILVSKIGLAQYMCRGVPE